VKIKKLWSSEMSSEFHQKKHFDESTYPPDEKR
jgi:hypothetical protein